MAYPFQITSGRVILRIVISSAHGGIIYNWNTGGCKSLLLSIFGSLFNLLSVVLCIVFFSQAQVISYVQVISYAILSSDLSNISCNKIEKQRDRGGPLCLSGKWLEKWKTRYDSLP